VFVGLDIRSDCIVAVRVGEDGTVGARAFRDGRTNSIATDAVQAVIEGTTLRMGAATRAGESVTALVAPAAMAAQVDQPATVSTGSAIALAEQWQGAARGARHIVTLAVDEHVHAGVVINGEIFRGAHGSAGDAAWLALNPVERDDYRKLGCLEAEISGKGTARRLVWRVKTGDHSRALDLAGTIGDITIAHVLDAARQGDGVAVSVVRDTARYIGMAVANLVAIIDPEVVVLGGLIASAGDLLIEPCRTEAVRRMSPRTVPRIVAAALGDEAAAIGAARAAMVQG
jgi:glucokinase